MDGNGLIDIIKSLAIDVSTKGFEPLMDQYCKKIDRFYLSSR